MIAHESRLNGRVKRLLFILLFIIVLLLSSTILSSLAEASPRDGAMENSGVFQPVGDGPVVIDGHRHGVRRNNGIVSSVVKAPIVPDGNVAGAVTDLVINLDRSMHPAVPGRTLLAGNQIKVTLPDDFVNTGLPVQTAFTPGCAPPAWTCTTGVLLQGWPQHPIVPMAPPGSSEPTFYTVSLEGTHTLVYTALVDVVPGTPAPGPGIKGMHLIALGFTNPNPGVYEIEVESQTGPGGTWEYGTGRVHIVPRARPSINVTSVFNADTPNTIYQQAGPNEATPLLYDFYLWDYDNEPFLDVDIEMLNSKRGLIKQGNVVVGQVRIKAPRGAHGQTVSTPSGPSTPVNAFLLGVPTARLNAQFTTGDELGRYEVTFSLNGGNSATMIVDVGAYD